MSYKYRGQLKNSKEVVDIVEFNGSVAICTDKIDRDIDDFNTIFYSAEKFKLEVLGIQPPMVIEETDEVVEVVEKKTKKSDS